MLRVELDIFSGRPNPSWVLSEDEEQELLSRVLEDRALMIPPGAGSSRLGYRGFIVTVLKEPEVGSPKIPSRFRIGGEPDSDSDTNLWLLDSSDAPDTEFDEYIRDFARTAIVKEDGEEAQSRNSLAEKGPGMSCSSNYFTSSTDFSFWNGGSYITRNNCYNYAANYRTNTYAQPGRRANRLFTGFTCSKVAAAIRADGWSDGCVSSKNLSICLVIWPERDFHFYRLCSGGRWCHKPGKTAARNTDNSGKTISNPQTCNRGPYTSVCGYFFANATSISVL